MTGKTLLRILETPIDARRVAAAARRCLRSDGRAVFLAFSFLYFFAATNLLRALGDTGARPASILAVFSYASLQVLPILVLAWAIDLAGARTLVGRAGGLMLGALLFVHVAVCAVDFLVFLYFGQRITSGVLFVMAETNFAESREFISTYGKLELPLIALYATLPFLTWRAVFRGRRAPVLREGFAVGLFMLSLAGLVQAAIGGPRGYNPVLAVVHGVLDYREELRAYHAIEQTVSVAVPGEVVSHSRAERNLHVLVLGESTSRAHMGLYGYERHTTPRLEAIRGELDVFEDVISPHSHTIPVLKKLLTFANLESTRSWYEYPILFDIYRAAGFKSYWISNQEAYGVWANAASAIASRADVRVFHNRESSRKLKRRLDGELLPYLDKILASEDAGDQFIVLHLRGTHIAYGERYPPDFEVFGAVPVAAAGRDFLDEAKRGRIDEYDNAVLYTDHVVSQIIERVRGVDASAFVLYVSDHGEEVYDERDFLGHTEAVGNRFMVEVPFVLWLSPKYRAAQVERVAALEQNLRSPYMTDDLIHTLLDLSSITTAQWDPRRSLARDEFDAGRKRVYAGVDYDRVLKHDRTRSLVRDPLGKVWAHRVNSIEKLAQTGSLFSGVELDLVLETKGGAPFFDVNHPPAESIGLSLDEYLSSGDEPSALKYWLDLKNLTEANKQQALSRLRWLMQRHGLRPESVIVESTEFAALRHLSDAGLRTSYYLPALDPNALSEAEMEELALRLAENARRSRAWAISCPGSMLDYAKAQLLPRLDNVKLLTWFPANQLQRWQDAAIVQRVADDEQVAVVLVGHRTPYDR